MSGYGESSRKGTSSRGGPTSSYGGSSRDDKNYQHQKRESKRDSRGRDTQRSRKSVDKRKRDNSKSSADSIDPPSRNWWAILPIVFTAVTVLLEPRGGWGAYHGGKNPRHPNPEKAAAKRRAQGKKH